MKWKPFTHLHASRLMYVTNLSERRKENHLKNIETTSKSSPVCQVLGIAASALYFHLRVPFNAVGIGQNHPPLGIDHETRTAGTVLPSPLPRQRKVRGAVDAPNLSWVQQCPFKLLKICWKKASIQVGFKHLIGRLQIIGEKELPFTKSPAPSA